MVVSCCQRSVRIYALQDCSSDRLLPAGSRQALTIYSENPAPIFINEQTKTPTVAENDSICSLGFLDSLQLQFMASFPGRKKLHRISVSMTLNYKQK